MLQYRTERDGTYDNILRVQAARLDLHIRMDLPFPAEIARPKRLEQVTGPDDEHFFAEPAGVRYASGGIVAVRSYDLAAMQSDPTIRQACVDVFDVNLAIRRWLERLAGIVQAIRRYLPPVPVR